VSSSTCCELPFYPEAPTLRVKFNLLRFETGSGRPAGISAGIRSLLGCCDLHYQHSVADYIGEVLLAFRASGHYVIPSTETNIDRQLEETNNGNMGKMHR
jgi:hypothetical protein